MIGLAGNNVMPARGGDWLRIHLLGKWKGARSRCSRRSPAWTSSSTRLAILLLFVALAFHSTFPDWVRHGTLIISIVTAVSIAICLLLLMHHRRSQRPSATHRGRISTIASKLGSGMELLSHKRLSAATLALSVLSSVMQIGTILLCQLAFGYHLQIWMPAIVFVAINLAIAVPSAPSGVGPFEAAAVLAYTWLGLSAESAFGIALAYHAVQFFPVTALGAVLYFRELTPGARRTASAEAAQPHT